ncbi:alpha/beta fold hydrolase [Janibacter alittae]|uniref:Alpha/beta fold hydrolase n=1 Tax=Janibacter alittae TaxID=3115209 RepID=A0ABZ2MKC6_9MICO
MSEPKLHAVTSGESGPRVAFCHGLLGQGRNWNQIAKGLADVCRPTLIDMPDHGHSPWSERIDYVDAAAVLAGTLRAIDPDEPWTLVGHSMGGKTAMVLALTEPELVERLAVVDISPAPTSSFTEFETFLAGMRAVDLDRVSSRADADDAMRAAAPDPTVRGFLLQNLRRDGAGWRWLPNLVALQRDIAAIAGWPQERISALPPFDGPVLWLAGANSPYVSEDNEPEMRRLFPRVRQVTVKNAGHWVHSEQPAVTTAALRALITSERG